MMTTQIKKCVAAALVAASVCAAYAQSVVRDLANAAEAYTDRSREKREQEAQAENRPGDGGVPEPSGEKGEDDHAGAELRHGAEEREVRGEQRVVRERARTENVRQKVVDAEGDDLEQSRDRGESDPGADPFPDGDPFHAPNIGYLSYFAER